MYDPSGNVLVSITLDRFHDETATGSLADPDNAPKARVSYTGMYHYLGGRTIATVNVGTNGGDAWTRPSTVPDRSDTVLVTSQTYDPAGWLEAVTDPRGLVTRRYQDNLGREVKTIEAYTNGTPADGSIPEPMGFRL